MKIIAWPSSDKYFLQGIKSFIDEEIPHLQSMEDHVIIDFKISTMKKIYATDWLSMFYDKKIIIISDKHLLPLACYFFKKFEGVIGVIEKKNAIMILMNYFKYDFFEHKVGISLSTKEYLSLVFFINEYSISQQAKKIGVSIKTAYGFRGALAKKMGLPRLLFIFIVG